MLTRAFGLVSLIGWSLMAPAAAEAKKIKMTLEVWGDQPSAQTAVRWGRPDFHDHDSSPPGPSCPGGEQVKELEMPDNIDATEPEIQTEGGKGTGYDQKIFVERESEEPRPSDHPGREYKVAIICKWRTGADHAETEFINRGHLKTKRSAGVNKYGEGNIRVYLNQAGTAGPIPMKPGK